MTKPAASARLGRRELAPLVDELHRRFGDGVPPSSVTLRGLSTDEHHAVADLLGSPRLPSQPVRLRVALLLPVLHLERVDQLRAAVEALRGPVDDRRAVRAARQADRQALWEWFAHASTGIAVIRDREAWLEGLRRAGVRGSVDRHRRLLSDVLAVLRALPADGETLAAFAQDTLGDPHALDPGRACAAIVLDALGGAASPRPARDAEATRQLWEQFGVAPDALSSTVTVLGLRAPAGHALAPMLTLSKETVEPIVLTLAQLRRWPLPPLPPTDTAYVVENPSVLAYAAREGWSTAPLLCSSGRPSVAVVTLVRQLAADGATVYQHADFDPAGVAITSWLADRAGTVPWQMDAGRYRAAASSLATTAALPGTIPPTPWDPALSAAMAHDRIAVYEEHIRSQLLAALTCCPSDVGRSGDI